MKISGFSYARNADSLYYPVRESIRSILPVCDEFIMVIGKGDERDRTREIVASIKDPRIRIVDTVWKEKEDLPNDHIFREQTNIGLRECRGDWCFHIQCDEVVHEEGLPAIKKWCEALTGDAEVEGMLLGWIHFWGDYRHYQVNHRFCPREIRIIRNGIGVQSWGDSQSFRMDERKLNVVQIPATVHHYGMVRPPDVMRRKQVAMDIVYHGRQAVQSRIDPGVLEYDYGSLATLPVFSGTHPAVMKEWIARMDWQDKLQYSGPSRTRFKHDRLRYRILTFLEQKLLHGRRIGGFRNYRLMAGKTRRLLSALQ